MNKRKLLLKKKSKQLPVLPENPKKLVKHSEQSIRKLVRKELSILKTVTHTPIVQSLSKVSDLPEQDILVRTSFMMRLLKKLDKKRRKLFTKSQQS